MGDDGRTVRLAFDVGGRDGGGLVVLLNGLGATAGVWTPLTARLGCRWLALDLPGHGGSARLASYDLETYAAALIPAIVDQARGAPATLVGHSLGGSVVLAIAASACGGWAPARAFALGVKIDWSEAEHARFAALAERPPRRFGTPDEALVQHRRLSGLEGVEVDSRLLRRGITKDGEGWQVAMDTRRLLSSLEAKHGRTDDDAAAISGALTLLTNVVLAWNTAAMQREIEAQPAR